MKKMDEIGFKLCKIQAEFFPLLLQKQMQLAHIYEKIYEFSDGAAYGPWRFPV